MRKPLWVGIGLMLVAGILALVRQFNSPLKIRMHEHWMAGTIAMQGNATPFEFAVDWQLGEASPSIYLNYLPEASIDWWQSLLSLSKVEAPWQDEMFRPGKPAVIEVLHQSSLPIQGGEWWRRISGFQGDAVESGWFAITQHGVRIGGSTSHQDLAWSHLLPSQAMLTLRRPMIRVFGVHDVDADGVDDRFWRIGDTWSSGSLWWIVSGATGELLKRDPGE